MSPLHSIAAGRRVLLDTSIRKFAPKRAYNAYFELIVAVRSRSEILSLNAIINDHGRQTLDRVLAALARIAKCSRQWIRPIREWFPVEVGPRDQFNSLTNHLFARHDMPRFLSGCWFEGGQMIRLFLQMGRGASVRKCRVPIPVTKKMVDRFLSAPDDLSVFGAIRWAQVYSLGGTESLARTLLATRLSCPQRDEPFWRDFIRLVINGCQSKNSNATNFSVTSEELHEMVEFLHSHKFSPSSDVLGYRVIGNEPLQPGLTVKGRSVRWLRRHMANWRNEIEVPLESAIEIQRAPSYRWNRSHIESFQWNENGALWTITQILDYDQLQVEGGIMQHCVGLYGRRCQSGTTTIWSMKEESGDVRKRVLTIEVWPDSKMVVQARGKRNRDPSPMATEMLRRWVEQENLDWPEGEEKDGQVQ